VHWFGFDLSPTFTLHNTFYDSRLVMDPQTQVRQVIGQNLNRIAPDVQFDLGLPRVSRIFSAPGWLRAGDKVKHVVEARVRYRHVTGVNNFQQTLRFDDLDVLSNTHEVEFNLTNRLLKKNSSGGVEDVLSWQLVYKRYLDPTFGGAVVAGQRNVVESAALLTGYAFLNGPRNQSPITSLMRLQATGRVGVEWRTDYDPVRHAFMNSSLSVDTHFGQFAVGASHNLFKTDPVLAPTANQLRLQARYGGELRRGWNYGVSTGYDFQGPPPPSTFANKPYLQFIQAQATYNTDCCGFSVQYSRFNNFTAFNNGQFRVAFALANIGSFGTLRRQNRIF
jgi:LPS-assembly protein